MEASLLVVEILDDVEQQAIFQPDIGHQNLIDACLSDDGLQDDGGRDDDIGAVRTQP